jgi:hypothetical protein
VLIALLAVVRKLIILALKSTDALQCWRWLRRSSPSAASMG